MSGNGEVNSKLQPMGGIGGNPPSGPRLWRDTELSTVGITIFPRVTPWGGGEAGGPSLTPEIPATVFVFVEQSRRRGNNADIRI